MLQSFTVKKSDGTTDVTLSLQGTGPNEATYMDKTTSLQAPRTMRVSHNLKAPGQKGSDRHYINVQHVVLDPLGLPGVVGVNVAITVPRNSNVNDVIIKDAIAVAVNYLGLAGVKEDLIDGIVS